MTPPTRPSHALRRRRVGRLIAVAVIAAIAAPRAASATNFRLFGPGPRYAAMAGAFTAVADDFTGAYANPAGIIQKTSTRVGVGYQYAYMDLTAQGEDDPNGGGTDGLYLGFVFTLPFIDWLKDRIAFGYNYFQPVDYVLSLQVPAATTPQFVLLEQYPRANIMHAGFATDPLPWFLVGFGATFNADLGGSLDLKPGIRSLNGVASILTTVDQESKSLFSPDVGAFVKGSELTSSLEDWTFGFTWRYRYQLDLQIPLTILLSGIPLKLDFTSTLLYTPETYTLGAAYHFGDDGVIAFDLAYNRYSNFKSPSLVIDTDIDIPILPLELKSGPAIDPDFSDTWTPRIGADYRVYAGESLDVWLRGGYAFEPTPAPAQTRTTNFVDGDKHILGIGTGLTAKTLFGADVSKANPTFNLTFQTQLLSKTRAVKDADVPPSNPGQPVITGEGVVYYLGAAISADTSVP